MRTRKIDIRSESPERIEELVALLTTSVDRALQTENERSNSDRVSARIREIGTRPGGRLADDASILRYIRAVDAHLGIRSHVDCASTDANIPLSMNLPAISIGAGGQGGGAHTPSEWYRPEGRETGLRRVMLALGRTSERSMTGSPRKNWAAEMSLALVCLAWGTTFVLVKNALSDISTVLFLAMRFSIATVILAAVYGLRGGRLTTAGLGAGVLTGGLLYSGYLLQTLGLRHTTPATSAFITSLYIVMVPLLSAAIYRKAPGPAEWTGIAFASVGMALLTLSSANFSAGSGELLTLGCAFAFALHMLALGHFSKTLEHGLARLLQIASCAVYRPQPRFSWSNRSSCAGPRAVLVALV